MKSKISLMIFLFAMGLVACKKENDIGIQIDGNGKPASASLTSGTSLDPSGKPTATTNNIGSQIDGNGKQFVNSNNSGTCIDPNGKPKPCAQNNYGIAIDPDGYGIAIDPDGKPAHGN